MGEINLHTARDNSSKNDMVLNSNRYKVINLGGLTKRSDCKSRVNYLTDHNHKETANFVNNQIDKKRYSNNVANTSQLNFNLRTVQIHIQQLIN